MKRVYEVWGFEPINNSQASIIDLDRYSTIILNLPFTCVMAAAEFSTELHNYCIHSLIIFSQTVFTMQQGKELGLSASYGNHLPAGSP